MGRANGDLDTPQLKRKVLRLTEEAKHARSSQHRKHINRARKRALHALTTRILDEQAQRHLSS